MEAAMNADVTNRVVWAVSSSMAMALLAGPVDSLVAEAGFSGLNEFVAERGLT